jgi:PTH1 family peptidyl-tRNA hydrolase
MKFLIVGLGNPGSEYEHSRHNIGFDIADSFTKKHGAHFTPERYAEYAHVSLKGKHFHLIKPTTYMNLSGKAARYWLDKLNLPPEQMLVLVDDLAIDFGKIRMRKNGSDAGHNGLKNIQELLQTIQDCDSALEIIFQKVVRLITYWGNGITKSRLNCQS